MKSPTSWFCANGRVTIYRQVMACVDDLEARVRIFNKCFMYITLNASVVIITDGTRPFLPPPIPRWNSAAYPMDIEATLNK